MAANNVLLDAVAVDTTGTGKRFNTPVTIYSDGAFGGGTLTIQSGLSDAGPWTTIRTTTVNERFNALIFGVYYLRAVLVGATTPSLTVVTS